MIITLLLIVILVPYIIIVESINYEVDQQNVEDENKKTTMQRTEFPYYAMVPVIFAIAFPVSLWSCICIKYGFYWKKRSEWLDQNREKWNKLPLIYCFKSNPCFRFDILGNMENHRK